MTRGTSNASRILCSRRQQQQRRKQHQWERETRVTATLRNGTASRETLERLTRHALNPDGMRVIDKRKMIFECHSFQVSTTVSKRRRKQSADSGRQPDVTHTSTLID